MAKKQWVMTNNAKATATEKAEIQRKAQELIDTVLAPKYILPPVENPVYNYVSGFKTKWAGKYFYFIRVYTCPRPEVATPTFDVNFARLEFQGSDRYAVSFMRHTGAWFALVSGVTLEKALQMISEDPWFQP
jgi:hypothetical protein